MKKSVVSTILLLLLGMIGLLVTYKVAMYDQTDLVLLIICIYVAFISLIYVVGHFVILILLIVDCKHQSK
ncbi:MAG: hypothetical protein K0Q49_745 [Haloplasmataceae bacterium]|jgi:hypothetical protein|nr:hypothetical protein [Haloplasmataceae bacterium]